MLWTIALIVFILWLLGFITANTFGGLIHFLLIVVVIIVAVQLIQGRRVL